MAEPLWRQMFTSFHVFMPRAVPVSTCISLSVVSKKPSAICRFHSRRLIVIWFLQQILLTLMPDDVEHKWKNGGRSGCIFGYKFREVSFDLTLFSLSVSVSVRYDDRLPQVPCPAACSESMGLKISGKVRMGVAHLASSPSVTHISHGKMESRKMRYCLHISSNTELYLFIGKKIIVQVHQNNSIHNYKWLTYWQQKWVQRSVIMAKLSAEWQ